MNVNVNNKLFGMLIKGGGESQAVHSRGACSVNDSAMMIGCFCIGYDGMPKA